MKAGFRFRNTVLPKYTLPSRKGETEHFNDSPDCEQGTMATRRSTRVRKVIPIDEKILRETEEDAEFWGQDAFADDEDDAAFDHNELSDQGEVGREHYPHKPAPD